MVSIQGRREIDRTHHRRPHAQAGECAMRLLRYGDPRSRVTRPTPVRTNPAIIHARQPSRIGWAAARLCPAAYAGDTGLSPTAQHHPRRHSTAALNGALGRAWPGAAAPLDCDRTPRPWPLGRAMGAAIVFG